MAFSLAGRFSVRTRTAPWSSTRTVSLMSSPLDASLPGYTSAVTRPPLLFQATAFGLPHGARILRRGPRPRTVLPGRSVLRRRHAREPRTADLVNHAVRARLGRIHVVIAVGVLLDLLDRLAGVLREDLFHESLRVQ